MSIEIARQTVAELRESGIEIELDEDGELTIEFPEWMGEPLRHVEGYQLLIHYDAIREVLEEEEADAER